MHYALTLYLLCTSPMGNVVPVKSGPVFETLGECLSLGANYQGPGAETKFTCDPVEQRVASAP